LFVVSVLVSIVCCRPIFILSSLPFFFLFWTPFSPLSYATQCRSTQCRRRWHR
jgi:hypothetical protein